MDEKNKLENKEIKISISLNRLDKDRYGRGRDSRYFRCFINNQDVSLMIAKFINATYSKAKATHNCIIVHGSGMDMAFYLQNKVYEMASELGYPNMFSPQLYNYI